MTLIEIDPTDPFHPTALGGTQWGGSVPSVGSSFLLKGLGGSADGDGDKTVTVRELYTYLSKQVPKKALEAPLDREQIPRILPGLNVLGEMAERAVVRY